VLSTQGDGIRPGHCSLSLRHCAARQQDCQILILRSAERASRRIKARLVASPFETRAKGALLRVRV